MKIMNTISLLLLASGVLFLPGCPDPTNPNPPPPSTYTVTYDGNGSTSGSVPTDAAAYEQGDSLTVLGNMGSLDKSGSFLGWNTEAGGGGISYTMGDVLVMGDTDLTLYAQWHSAYFALGDSGPAGGWIFYLNPDYATDGWRYLEAAPSGWDGGGADQSYAWSADITHYANSSATAIGSGKANTRAIVTLLSNLSETGRAAQVCADFTLGGCSDWFLPSEYELDEMYTQSVAGLSSGNYWSSSEHGNDSASRINMASGTQSWDTKDKSYLVRAIRLF
jgi:hypothetical protein